MFQPTLKVDYYWPPLLSKYDACTNAQAFINTKGFPEMNLFSFAIPKTGGDHIFIYLPGQKIG